MKKTKSQSGITLIALIITILVLLILAGVAIKSIQDGGILTKAQQAADKYTQAQNDELADLDSYIAEIEKAQQKIGAVKDQHGNLLTVGQFIKYGEDIYGVIYNDDVEGLQIIATSIKDDADFTLNGFNDWENRFQRFKEACAPYVKKSLGAIEGRVFGATFNEMKVDLNDGSLTNGIKYIVRENGVDRPLKIYGYMASGISGKDSELTSVLFPLLDQALGGESFWCSTANMTTYGSECIIYEYNTEEEEIQRKTLAKYKLEDASKDIIFSAYNNQEATSKILPIILLDQRIEVTSGSGSYEDPYTYTFNVQ